MKKRVKQNLERSPRKDVKRSPRKATESSPRDIRGLRNNIENIEEKNLETKKKFEAIQRTYDEVYL